MSQSDKSGPVVNGESRCDGDLDEYFRVRGFCDDRKVQRFFARRFWNLHGFDLSRQFAFIARLADVPPEPAGMQQILQFNRHLASAP